MGKYLDQKVTENSSNTFKQHSQPQSISKSINNKQANRSYMCLVCDKSTKQPIFNEKQCCLQCPHCNRSWCLEDPHKIKKRGNLDLIQKRYLEIKFSAMHHAKHDHHDTKHFLSWIGTNILGNLGDVNDTLNMLDTANLENLQNMEDPDFDLESLRAQQRLGIYHPSAEKYHATHPVIIEALPKLDIKGNKNHKLLLEHTVCPICQIDFIDAQISDDDLADLLLTDHENEEQMEKDEIIEQDEKEEPEEEEDIFKMMEKSRKLNNDNCNKKQIINDNKLEDRSKSVENIVNLYDNNGQSRDMNGVDIGNELITSCQDNTISLQETMNIDINNMMENENDNSLIINEWKPINNEQKDEMNESENDNVSENDDENENENENDKLELSLNKCKHSDINCDMIVRLWCGHIFHSDCVIPWLSKQNTCPLCRYELPSNNPKYELKRRVETYDHDGIFQVMT